MRQVSSAIQRDGSGTATLIPEEPEDMWHSYNLIQPGDRLRASAVRRVSRESGSGSTQTERVHVNLTIQVTKLDFDAQASALHVSGTIAEENNVASLGSFHTLDLELHRKFTIEKGEGWDSIALQQLKEATDSRSRAVLWAVMMEEGAANICFVTEYQTKLVQHITSKIPAKRGIRNDYDKGINRFNTLVLDTLERHMELKSASSTDLPPVLLASPSFTATKFRKFVEERAQNQGNKTLRALAQKLTVTHSSGATLSALAEVLKSSAVTNQLADSKFTRETQLIDKFYASLRRDDGKAWYGRKEVLQCVEEGAVGRGGGVLLINNNLFRSQNVAERKQWVALVDRVRDVEGGEVRVLSEAHESGKRLEALGGLAALLSYPIFDLEGEEQGDDGNT